MQANSSLTEDYNTGEEWNLHLVKWSFPNFFPNTLVGSLKIFSYSFVLILLIIFLHTFTLWEKWSSDPNEMCKEINCRSLKILYFLWRYSIFKERKKKRKLLNVHIWFMKHSIEHTFKTEGNTYWYTDEETYFYFSC